MKYRKKPVVIEAEQFLPPNGVPEGVMNVYKGDPKNPESFAGEIWTPEGRMQVSYGDWIITGVKGEKYPCKPDIFEMTYEVVDKTDNVGKTDKGATGVRAKATCTKVNAHNYGIKDVSFEGVNHGDGENADFAKATPAFNSHMAIDKDTPAYDFFQEGKSYYVTFEEAIE